MKYSRFISLFLMTVLSTFAQSQEQEEDTGLGLGEDELIENISEENPLADDEEMVNQIDKLNEESDGSLEFTSFIYSERGRRNPFLRPGSLKSKTLTKEEEAIGLEGYDIAAFKLTAVLWDVKYPKAIVKASDTESYVIEEGSKIGRRNGYVAKIREGEIVIIESNAYSGEDEASDKVYKTQVLKLGR